MSENIEGFSTMTGGYMKVLIQSHSEFPKEIKTYLECFNTNIHYDSENDVYLIDYLESKEMEEVVNYWYNEYYRTYDFTVYKFNLYILSVDSTGENLLRIMTTSEPALLRVIDVNYMQSIKVLSPVQIVMADLQEIMITDEIRESFKRYTHIPIY